MVCFLNFLPKDKGAHIKKPFCPPLALDGIQQPSTGDNVTIYRDMVLDQNLIKLREVLG